jgi:hypothetical protein
MIKKPCIGCHYCRHFESDYMNCNGSEEICHEFNDQFNSKIEILEHYLYQFAVNYKKYSITHSQSTEIEIIEMLEKDYGTINKLLSELSIDI